VGDAEKANHTISLRKRDGSRLNDMHVGAFMDMVHQKIATRAADL
jgi:threonyl-tRNA synthetase